MSHWKETGTDRSQERTHVPIERHKGPRCWSCSWKGHSQQGQGQHSWRWSLNELRVTGEKTT